MSRPSLTDKHARIVGDSRIARVVVPSTMELWGLRSWLHSLRLLEHFEFFRNMEFDEIMSLTERKLYTKFSPELVYKIIDSVDVVKAQQNLIYNMKRYVVTGKRELHYVLLELGRVLPSQFEALLGRVSNQFVEVMQLIYFRLSAIKPLTLKQECQFLFYKYCLRAELSDSFMEADKDFLKKWRVAYQTERKLLKQQNKTLKK